MNARWQVSRPSSGTCRVSRLPGSRPARCGSSRAVERSSAAANSPNARLSTMGGFTPFATRMYGLAPGRSTRRGSPAGTMRRTSRASSPAPGSPRTNAHACRSSTMPRRAPVFRDTSISAQPISSSGTTAPTVTVAPPNSSVPPTPSRRSAALLVPSTARPRESASIAVRAHAPGQERRQLSRRGREGVDRDRVRRTGVVDDAADGIASAREPPRVAREDHRVRDAGQTPHSLAESQRQAARGPGERVGRRLDERRPGGGRRRHGHGRCEPSLGEGEGGRGEHGDHEQKATRRRGAGCISRLGVRPDSAGTRSGCRRAR